MNGDGELPEGWAATTVAVVAEPLVSGFASGKKDVLGGLRHLRMNNISNQCALDLSLVRTVPQALRNENLLMRDGDCICCTTNSGKLVGKVALFNREGDWAFSNHLTRVRPRSGLVEPRWLYLSLRHLWMHGAYEEFIKNWVNQAALPKDALAASEVRLAPLPEQHRIVEQVEALLAQVNMAKDRLDRVKVILKRFRQAVLAAACSGRLTEEWREKHSEIESATELLDKITRHRAELRLPTATRPIDDEGIEIPGDDLPETWTWCRVGNFADVRLGGTPSRKEPPYWTGNIPWVSSGEVANCRISTTTERISRKGLENSNAKLYPVGTVLIAMIGEGKTRGQSAILDIEACTNQNAAGLIFDAGMMNPEYVWFWALGEYEKNRDAGRGGNQPALNGAKVRALPVPLPPVDEQTEIVRVVRKMFALADTIEARLTTATSRADKLPQSILSKAFKGELVPTEAELARAEGRTFESAEEMLKRVKSDGPEPTKQREKAGRRKSA